MQAQVVSTESGKRTLRVEVTLQEMQPFFDEALEMFREEAQIEGFRKGKAPRQLIKSKFEGQIEAEAIQAIIEEYYRQAIDHTNTDAIDMGQIENLNYKRGEPVSFDVIVETMPDYSVATYRGLTIEKPVHTVTDDEVEAAIGQMRQHYATFKETEEVKAGDEVTCDIQVLDAGGVPIIGKKYQDRRIPLTTKYVGQDFIDGLIGARIGDTRNLHVRNIGKKDATEPDSQHFAVTVRKIEEVVLPAVDDEFAKDLGFKDLADLHHKVREDIEHRWGHETEHKVNDRIIDEIIKGNDLPSPEPLVRNAIARMIRVFQERSKNPNIDETYLSDAFRPAAIREVKWTLARRKIAELEKLAVTEDDVLNYRTHMARHNNVSVDEIKIDFKTEAERKNFDDYLLEKKTVTFLESVANVTVVEDQPEKEPAEEPTSSLIV